MKRLLFLLGLLWMVFSAPAQTLKTQHPLYDSAFSLAVWTIDHNTHDGILHAGAGYGGEWTRDAAINSLNAVSLLRPQVAEKSLWNVTNDSLTIGHQYWDKMLWAMAAWNHYQVTGDTLFLQKAYNCACRTLAELDSCCYDASCGLYMGPAVFQDGIEAYPEPIYDPDKWDDSFVLHHPHSDSIRCLSTNVMYSQAILSIWQMAERLGIQTSYLAKYRALNASIIDHFYDYRHHRFYYLIDHQGHRHEYQEGLGVSLAIGLLGLPEKEVRKIVRNLELTQYGIPSVSPSFPRNSKEKPGRHNMMIWPHINAFYAVGCAENRIWDEFYRELDNMTRLAMVNGMGNFYEIYTVEGEPSGGWQCGALWDKKEHQTWCATGYLRLWIQEVFGMDFFNNQMFIAPAGMEDGSECTLSGIHWRGNDITITVRGSRKDLSRQPEKILINGRPTTHPFLKPNQGSIYIDITL